MAGFGDLISDLDSMVMDSLSDGAAQYLSRSGEVLAEAVPVIIDRNLMQNGPEGAFRSDAVGVSWQKSLLAEVERGGRFVYGAELLLVEDVIADDGHMVTAACMVQP